MKLTEYSLRRPVTTLMVFLSFIFIGFIVTRLIPLEFFPAMEYPFVNINIPYPNSTPQEIERQITRPVEEVIATISDIKRMNSYSTEDSCGINLEFDWGVNSKIKAIEAKEKIDNIIRQNRFYHVQLERLHIFFEDLFVYLMATKPIKGKEKKLKPLKKKGDLNDGITPLPFMDQPEKIHIIEKPVIKQ